MSIAGYPRSPSQPAFTPDLFGPLAQVTPPTTGDANAVVTLARAKRHLRVDGDMVDEDNDILETIEAATLFCEQSVSGHYQFRQATYDLPLAYWWGIGNWWWPQANTPVALVDSALRLPRPPLQSVTSVSYYDSTDTSTTLATTFYSVRTAWRQPGQIEWKPQQYGPALSPWRVYPVTVRFVCGYSTVPATVQRAVLLVCGWMYQNREPSEMELQAVQSLLTAECGWGSYK